METLEAELEGAKQRASQAEQQAGEAAEQLAAAQAEVAAQHKAAAALQARVDEAVAAAVAAKQEAEAAAASRCDRAAAGRHWRNGSKGRSFAVADSCPQPHSAIAITHPSAVSLPLPQRCAAEQRRGAEGGGGAA